MRNSLTNFSIELEKTCLVSLDFSEISVSFATVFDIIHASRFTSVVCCVWFPRRRDVRLVFGERGKLLLHFSFIVCVK